METTIGENIRWHRKERRIRQSDLAQRIGKDTSMVVRYEAGAVDIPSSVLLAIADALGVSLDDLAKPKSERQG